MRQQINKLRDWCFRFLHVEINNLWQSTWISPRKNSQSLHLWQNTKFPNICIYFCFERRLLNIIWKYQFGKLFTNHTRARTRIWSSWEQCKSCHGAAPSIAMQHINRKTDFLRTETKMCALNRNVAAILHSDKRGFNLFPFVVCIY